MPTFSNTTPTQYPKAIVSHTHPPVMSNKLFAAVAVALVAGTVLSEDLNHDLVAYDGTAPAVAVLLEDVDTTVATTANVLVHGVVDATLITPNTPAALASLAAHNIYS